jgi:hypothetical protein
MKVAVAHSEDIDSPEAIEEVIQACIADLDGLTPQAGIMIASMSHDFDTIQERILREWPELELIGGSGDGELTSITGAAEDSVALMLFHSERVRIRAGLGQNTASDPVKAAQDAVGVARTGEQEAPALAVVIPESWNLDINCLVQAFQDELGQETLLVGGLTSDASKLSPTRVAFKGDTLTDAVACLLFFGPLKLAASVKCGSRPVGTKHHVVTRAEGSHVREIDGKPAGDLWVHYFGSHSVFNPLAVFPEDDGEYFIAAAPHIEEDGAVFFSPPIPEGSVVRPVDMTSEDMLRAAAEGVDEAIAAYPGETPDAALVFSCSGRKAVLGTRVGEEVDLLRKGLPTGVPAIGFFTNGELGPLKDQSTTRCHGFTFVAVLIGED